jgi:NAD(P)H-dependent FMN reductase
MEIPAEYLVVSASLREASLSRALANELLGYYRESKLNSYLLDLRQIRLPFCDADAAYGDPNVETCQTLLNAARVIIVATPIYNFDVNAAAKNLVELTGDAWENKVVGFLCAAGGSSSYMSVMGLANSLMLDFRCVVIPRFVYATRHDFSDGLHLRDEVRARVRELGETSQRIRVNWSGEVPPLARFSFAGRMRSPLHQTRHNWFLDFGRLPFNELGYLATYVTHLKLAGKLEVKPGVTFQAGKAGEYTIGNDGEIVYGKPLIFTKETISKFNFWTAIVSLG